MFLQVLARKLLERRFGFLLSIRKNEVNGVSLEVKIHTHTYIYIWVLNSEKGNFIGTNELVNDPTTLEHN